MAISLLAVEIFANVAFSQENTGTPGLPPPLSTMWPDPVGHRQTRITELLPDVAERQTEPGAAALGQKSQPALRPAYSRMRRNWLARLPHGSLARSRPHGNENARTARLPRCAPFLFMAQTGPRENTSVRLLILLECWPPLRSATTFESQLSEIGLAILVSDAPVVERPSRVP